MNIEAILALIFHLAPVAVLTIEKVHGDAVAGAAKKVMAKDALAGATAGALSVLTGDNAGYAEAASEAVSEAIDGACVFTKKSGDYQKATAAAAAAKAAKASTPDAFLGQGLTT